MKKIWNELKKSVIVKVSMSVFAVAAALILTGAGTDTAALMWNQQTGQCNSDVDFRGTTKIGGTTISSTLVGNLTAATNANTASAIVKRDSSGNFSAGTITANLTGNASANPTISSGTLAAMPLTNTKKIGDIYIDTGNADAYICCATGADTTGFKKINN